MIGVRYFWKLVVQKFSAMKPPEVSVKSDEHGMLCKSTVGARFHTSTVRARTSMVEVSPLHTSAVRTM